MRWRSARHGSDQGDEGMVLVWFALLLVVLLGFAALAIDVSRWYLVANRAQKRADAAALAGAVYLPDDPTSALAVARALADENSDDGNLRVTVSPEVGDRPNRLKVTVTETVDNFFGNVLGRATQDVTRTAVAEYSPPLAMGSPTNQLGNDPESSATPGTPKFPNLWANIAGPDALKQNGDAFQGDDCASSPRPDNCTSTNTDYDPNGYYYAVRVAPGFSGPLRIQVFDPALVDVGMLCDKDNDDGSNLAGAAALPGSFNPYYPGSIPPSERYAPVLDTNNPGAAGRWCTGDNLYNAHDRPATTYRVIGPAKIPGDPASAPSTPLCEVTFPAVHGDLTSLLPSTTPQPGAPDLLVTYFRQWYTLCDVTAPSGDYFVQVLTSGSSGNGFNRFSLRAGVGGCPTCFADSSSVSIFGNARMSVYANVGSNTLTSFYLTRVIPGGKGRTLVLSLFDIGDAAHGVTGTLTVVPPTDSNVSGGFADCTYTAPPGNSTGPPWGAFSSTNAGCTIANVSSDGYQGYQGQWIQVRIPIPDDYSCDAADPTKCWATISYMFNGVVHDVTSWTAYMEGDPVRLIK